MLMPWEFFRPAPKIACGREMRSLPKVLNWRSWVAGCWIRVSTGTRGSTSLCTKEELAPFSSRRRTRYGSRSLCAPTGA
ncbi:hypothetical protein D9M72_583920 [compost metagenome]